MQLPFYPKLCAATVLSLSTFLIGCNSQSVSRNLSPVIGNWQIQGDTPAADANMPRFTALHFRRDGSLDARYVVASGALGGIIKSASKQAQETDSYVLVGKTHLRIIEGSRALEYTYDVHDGKLFIKSQDSNESTVYVHSHDSSDGAANDPDPSQPTENPDANN
jgi:hypothetical protein